MLSAEQHEEAVRWFREAVDLNSQLEPAHFFLGVALLKQGWRAWVRGVS